MGAVGGLAVRRLGGRSWAASRETGADRRRGGDFHSGGEEELREAIDGADVGRRGWSVAPQTDQPQAAVFVTGGPVEAPALDITLCFLSGKPNSYFRDFTISVTTDPQPSLSGTWRKLPPTRINATGPELELGEDGHLRANGFASDAVFQLTIQPGKQPISGFRVDAFPSFPVKGRALPQWQGRRTGISC